MQYDDTSILKIINLCNQLWKYRGSHSNVSREWLDIIEDIWLSINEMLEVLSLECFPEDIEEAKRQSCDNYTNNEVRELAFINILCLNRILARVKEQDPTCEVCFSEELLNIWEFSINGAAIKLGDIRIVLIPIIEIDWQEFRVPQEWLDIPEWAGDYYLAIIVDVDENGCSVMECGYTTHQQFRTNGKYNQSDRTYSINKDDLNEYFHWMLLTKQLVPINKTVNPLQPLSREQERRLLHQLGDPSIQNPRLENLFKEWAPLLANGELIEQLYRRRIEVAAVRLEVPVARSWMGRLEKTFEETWQTVAEVIDIIGTQEASLAFASSGGDRRFRDSAHLTKKTILELISLLSTSKDKLTRLRVIELLGRNAKGNQDAIACLQDLLNNSDDKDLRREAAVSLGEIDPRNEQAGAKRAKMINLGPLHKVALVLTLMPGSDRNNMQIYLLVNAVSGEFLPPHLEMSVLDEKGETFDEMTSRTEDYAMQLDFAGEEGDRFTFKLALGDACFTEKFVI